MNLPTLVGPSQNRSKAFLSMCLFAGVLFQPSGRMWAQAAAAPAAKPEPDVITFTNGDQLTGTLEKAIGNSYTFKSDMTGEFTVTADKIKALKANGSFVVLQKGEVVKRAPMPNGPLEVDSKNVTMTPSTSVANTQPTPQVTPVANVEDVIDVATYNKEVLANPGPLHGWTGSITGGASVVQASDYGETFTLAASLARIIPTVDFLPPRTRSTVNVMETYGKLTSPTIPQTNPPTPNSVAKTSIFHADAEHDRYINARMYWLLDTSFDHNFSQGLDLQQIYGVGFGATLIKDAVQELDAKADIHYERQAFIPPPFTIPPTPSNPDKDLIGTSFAEQYKRTLPKKILFVEALTIIPAWNDLSAYSANGMIGLTFPVYKRFGFNTSLSDSFLNDPQYGYQKNSFTFVVGATYTLP